MQAVKFIKAGTGHLSNFEMENNRNEIIQYIFLLIALRTILALILQQDFYPFVFLEIISRIQTSVSDMS